MLGHLDWDPLKLHQREVDAPGGVGSRLHGSDWSLQWMNSAQRKCKTMEQWFPGALLLQCNLVVL
jgi:hypothetical protein